MNNLLEQPLSQIVLENFQTAYIFEKNGLDFCCKGKRTLKAACSDKGIAADDILKELNEVLSTSDRSFDFNRLSLSTLADYIVEIHHQYVKQNLPLIGANLFKVATKHGESFPYMKKVFVLFTQVKTELEDHLLKEEQILFPAIKAKEGKSDTFSTGINVQELISMMEEEHDAAGTLMAKIREITGNYAVPDGACTTFQLTLNALRAFEADLHQHVHLENNLLFPKAIALLDKNCQR